MTRISKEELERNKTDKGSRRSFLRRAATVTVGAGIAGAGWVAPREAAATEANPLLTAQAMQDIRRHENAHVSFLQQALGNNARPKPTFVRLRQFGYVQFFKTSNTLENTGVGAYLGAAPFISDPTLLAAAGSIGFIEARHASFLNMLFNKHITTNVFGQEQSFERPLTQDEVLSLAGKFFVNLNGDPPLSFSTTTRSAANDIAILNFALALEYLESDFYNINVPRLFGG